MTKKKVVKEKEPKRGPVVKVIKQIKLIRFDPVEYNLVNFENAINDFLKTLEYNYIVEPAVTIADGIAKIEYDVKLREKDVGIEPAINSNEDD